MSALYVCMNVGREASPNMCILLVLLPESESDRETGRELSPLYAQAHADTKA